jgi:hypothetical protein
MSAQRLFLPAALALSMAFVGTAQAAITVYTTQASYLAAISAPGVDTFDDLDPTDTLATPQSRSAGAYSYNASSAPNSSFFPAGTTGADVWLSTDDRQDTITFNGFSADVRGFGGYFFRTDRSGALTSLEATINLSVTDASGTVTQGLLNPSLTSFVGFVSTGEFTNIKLWVGTAGTGVDGVWATANDLTLGTTAPIPEPETYALLLGGLALLAGVARRRKA